MTTHPQLRADLATYEHHVWACLQWLCDECGYCVVASNDIRAGEEAAPEGPWAWRHARGAMAAGWYLAATGGPCLCPQCAEARGFTNLSTPVVPNPALQRTGQGRGAWSRFRRFFSALTRR